MASRIKHHSLVGASIGTQRSLVSVHYGAPGKGPKAYLQASLHADELPGMLVLHHLRQLLERAQVEGQIVGEIVLVPVANPIGLAQRVLHEAMGRFELGSGENFNRGFVDFYPQIMPTLNAQLGCDPGQNRLMVHALQGALLNAQPPRNELVSLRHTLSVLAHDSDLVLDLHCDREASLHIYTDAPFWADIEPLARYLGVATAVLGKRLGGDTFEESCGQLWWRLAQEFGPKRPVPLGCVSATVELRGQRDLGHAQAQQDAQAIFSFLQHRGHVCGTPAPLPQPVAEPLTWEGMCSVQAPCAGLVVYLQEAGAAVQQHEAIAEIIDPYTNSITPVLSPIAGIVYARHLQRYAHAGVELCRVVGAVGAGTGGVHLL